ncbi:MAG: transposase [Bacteroidaceae bacterium]|nr:transposase [Bacteroidaceae bacterium]
MKPDDITLDNSPLLFLDKKSFIRVSRGNLPHWSQQGKAQFVSFRLADSLPQSKVEELNRVKQQWRDTHPLPWDDDETLDFEYMILNTFNRWLDSGYGSCVLSNADVRQVVCDALRFYDGSKYKLWAYVVMPNHVHLLASPKTEYEMGQLMGSVKSFSSRQINQMLRRTGPLWQREVFDRIVRSGEHFERVVRYIKSNPNGLSTGSYSLYVADNIPGGQISGVSIE